MQRVSVFTGEIKITEEYTRISSSQVTLGLPAVMQNISLDTRNIAAQLQMCTYSGCLKAYSCSELNFSPSAKLESWIRYGLTWPIYGFCTIRSSSTNSVYSACWNAYTWSISTIEFENKCETWLWKFCNRVVHQRSARYLDRCNVVTM